MVQLEFLNRENTERIRIRSKLYKDIVIFNIFYIYFFFNNIENAKKLTFLPFLKLISSYYHFRVHLDSNCSRNRALEEIARNFFTTQT